MAKQGEKLLMTVLEAAAETGICRSRAYEMAATGEWPVVRIGRSVRVPREALIEWIRANTIQSAGHAAEPKQ